MCALSVVLVSAGCRPGTVSTRAQHYVDGQLVVSHPVPAAAYAAYLRARLALDSDPPHLDVAADSIRLALRYGPRDPHLWATRAEIELQAGDREAAVYAASKALELSPDYPLAQGVLARLGSR